MNKYFQTARDNIFIFIAYMIVIAFLLFLSVELLRLARPLKIIGILGILGSIWAIFKYPDFQKYLTTNKTKKPSPIGARAYSRCHPFQWKTTLNTLTHFAVRIYNLPTTPGRIQGKKTPVRINHRFSDVSPSLYYSPS